MKTLATEQHQESMDATNNLQKSVDKLQTDVNDLKNTVSDLQNQVDVLETKITKPDTNNFLENNSLPSMDDIMNYFNIVQEYFNSIPAEKILALVHIFLILSLLYIIIFILTIYYSNYFINSLNLGVKYPRIGKLLEYRSKFQRYYIITYSIGGVILMLSNLALDIYVFIN